MPDVLTLPDLASRALRGSVVAASDELFAERENLIKPGAAVFNPATFGPKGQVYDGWETRRRRGPDGELPGADEHDWVIVRLGAPGVVHAVVVDTAYFTGNFPQSCSVEACCLPGYPDQAALDRALWAEIVPRSPLKGDTPHVFEVPAVKRFSHVRLRIYPDGGVARLRVHGVVVPDPGLLEGLTFDLAALENGGDVRACSDRFYSAPRNAISPGLSRVMGEGWETRRRRSPGSEWLVVGFAAAATVSLAEIDTSGYIGNSPGAAQLRGRLGEAPGLGDSPEAESLWEPLLPRTALLPDTPHRFRVRPSSPCDLVRLDVFPDGGVARLRLYGSLTPEGLAAARRRWAETAPLPGLARAAGYPELVGDKGTVLLIHGGLWEDIGADRCWGRTGVIDGLERRGLTVIAPDRLRRAPDWTTEARHIAEAVAGLADAPAGGAGAPHADGHPLTVIGGSFGCAVAVRLALEFPRLAGKLILAWPAALADQFTIVRLRSGLSRAGARGTVLDALLGTAAVPSATDAEVALLDLPVGIVPALPPTPVHPRSAVDALLRLLPSAVELPGCPEAPRPEFTPHLEQFLDSVTAFAGS